ncbi:hypothetical protein C2845_PM08G12050 [Panicum miliaceum]|uniref:Uncharacterized protein n=1 Tax=Panicum miliaceum TaxID=4540 RepID=A0A3L6R362_PANMI|nr:hypothetical protein C2845_PM08G12050 [Panicum miliaceum]
MGLLKPQVNAGSSSCMVVISTHPTPAPAAKRSRINVTHSPARSMSRASGKERVHTTTVTRWPIH